MTDEQPGSRKPRPPKPPESIGGGWEMSEHKERAPMSLPESLPNPPQPGQTEPVHRPRFVATIMLRLPDEEAGGNEVRYVRMRPGDRARVLALIRNQSSVVDKYQLSVSGLPDGWWSIYPDTIALVPYGSGASEAEVEIQLHPPRSPEARIWNLEVVAHSRAYETTAATVPLVLRIQRRGQSRILTVLARVAKWRPSPYRS